MADEPFFDVTFHLADGQSYDFTIDSGTARAAVERLTRTQPPVFTREILTDLESDRELLLHATTRAYGYLLRLESGRGMFYMHDEDGGWWPIPTRNVVTLRVSDPAAPKTGSRRPLGFVLDDYEALSGGPEQTP